MLKFSDIEWKNQTFRTSIIFGTAGIKVLSSKDAKKLYTGCTAAVLRAKDISLKPLPSFRRMQRMYGGAKEINKERADE